MGTLVGTHYGTRMHTRVGVYAAYAYDMQKLKKKTKNVWAISFRIYSILRAPPFFFFLLFESAVYKYM